MTVYGIDRIREFLGGFNSNYVIIGGSATNMNLENGLLEGRTTHDIDMIVVCEAITPEYLSCFWEMVRVAGYTSGFINTDKGPKRTFYRFDKPKDPSFPKYIELFCRVPDSITVPDDMHIVHISSGDENLSSFSAIMMDEEYYNFAVSHTRELHGVSVLDQFALIVLKAKAFISNLARKESGQKVHQDDIDKHKKDVYRLSYLLNPDVDHLELPLTIYSDMHEFITRLQDNPVNTKALSSYMGVGEIAQTEFVELLKRVFSL